MIQKIFLSLLCTIILTRIAQAQSGLTMQQAMRTAQQNNPFLKPESLNTAIAQGDVITAGLRPNPKLNNQTLQLMESKRFAEGTKFYNSQNRQVWWQLTKEFQLAGQR